MKGRNEKVIERIRDRLLSMKDEAYAGFTASLIPTVERSSIIGVRTPELRKYARALSSEEREIFFRDLPHKYYEENNLHAFLIEGIRDYDSAIKEIERFLPYVDNWATCDSMRPKIFKAHTDELISRVCEWIGSEQLYTVRYAIGMLHSFFLDVAFSPAHLELAASVESDEYYVNMMTAWYFATAMAKQREAAVSYFTERKLHEPVFSMARRKCYDSFRISREDKALLRSIE